MIKGYAKFDSIVVGELTAAFIGPTLDFKAKAAFVDSKTGQTHGWTTSQTWSPPVIAKLKELRELMEMDLGAVHFEGGGEVVSNTVTPQRVGPAATGLSEHVGEISDEQV
jgi:hypothetical protein